MDVECSDDRDHAQLKLAELTHLWELARVLATYDMIPQAIVTLEAICAGGVSDCSADTQQIVACAYVLLAEICVLAARSETTRVDRKLWRKRLARAEQCVEIVERIAASQPAVIALEWHWRLLKAKCLLLEVSTADDVAKRQQVLELLCAAVRSCTASRALAVSTGFQTFFLGRLRTHLVALHAALLLASQDEGSESSSRVSFLQSVERVQQSVPDDFDPAFQLWLAEATCHALVTSLHFDDSDETHRRFETAAQRLQSVSTPTSMSRELRVYHLVLSGLFYLRAGEANRIAPVLEEIHALLNAPSDKPTGILTDAYLESVLDGLKLYALARSDPCAALEFSTQAIHRVQTNVLAYAASGNHAVHTMLVAALFDMLDAHCRLQAQQCRYAELGLSLAQMLQLFATHNDALAPTVFYRFFVARCHILIAKYAVALGKLKETVSNVNFVIETLLPPITASTSSYPDAYLSVWVDALDALTYCGSAADASNAVVATPGDSTPPPLQIRQLCPNAVLLEFAARILEMDALRRLIYSSSSSIELRVKYDLALAKWLWASHELAANPPSGGSSVDLGRHVALERLRPRLLALVHESLARVRDHVGCSETMGELLALLGPLQLARGESASGEETLRTNMRMSLESKNVLLQSRLLADIFRFYDARHDAAACATTADKYEKKVRVLQKRIAQALTEAARNKLVMRWKSGD